MLSVLRALCAVALRQSTTSTQSIGVVDFSSKKILLFAASGRSGFEQAIVNLQPSTPNAKIMEGTLLNRWQNKASIAEWATQFWFNDKSTDWMIHIIRQSGDTCSERYRTRYDAFCEIPR